MAARAPPECKKFRSVSDLSIGTRRQTSEQQEWDTSTVPVETGNTCNICEMVKR
jgi:hypothetical protein